MTFKHEQQVPPVLWAVVADRSRARMLSASWPQVDSWEEVVDLAHVAGALTPHEAYTDGPGTFAEYAGGHHSGDKHTDFRHQTAERFAGEIVDVLQEARTNNRFGKLVLAAPPLFLGVLRKKLPSTLSGMVVLELDKDYTQLGLEQVADHLQAALAAQTEV